MSRWLRLNQPSPHGARAYQQQVNDPMPRARVYVVKYDDRPDLAMRYRCPLTRKQHQRTCGTGDREVAERLAREWEEELNEGGYAPDVQVEWRVFRSDFAENHLAGLDVDAAELFTLALDSFESICRPERLAAITADHVDLFRTQLRAAGLRAAAIRSRVDRFLRAMDWAHAEGLLRRKLSLPAQPNDLGLPAAGDVHATAGG